MRLDTDSLFTGRLCYDPFEVIHVHRRSYAWYYVGSDPPDVTVNLWPFLRNYSQTHPSVEHQLRANNWEWSQLDENGDETVRFIGYGNNFEVVRLDAFRRPEVKEWLDALEGYPEGAFKWRWGTLKFQLIIGACLFTIL
jgi:mannosyltransferase